MSGITVTLRALHQGENALAHELAATAERHTAEHEVHHVALDLANWSAQHGAVLASTAKRYGLQLSGSPDHNPEGLPATARERTPELFGGSPQPGIVLLRDLRDLHLAATENSLYWEMLGQAAQATKDQDLLGAVSDCHPQTLRQIRWTNTMIKVLSPQVLSAL
ncbi:hypothetical protein [Streptomyces sp. NPDC008139]|uniref:hypothetical protein n=1 Tax=Streptomyces sp. NPDC008139 TaxID=3364814 RepID=UPI0036DFE6F1